MRKENRWKSPIGATAQPSRRLDRPPTCGNDAIQPHGAQVLVQAALRRHQQDDVAQQSQLRAQAPSCCGWGAAGKGEREPTGRCWRWRRRRRRRLRGAPCRTRPSGGDGRLSAHRFQASRPACSAHSSPSATTGVRQNSPGPPTASRLASHGAGRTRDAASRLQAPHVRHTWGRARAAPLYRPPPCRGLIPR